MSKMQINYEGSFSTKILSFSGEVECITDAPKEHGGKGERLSPTDIFAASLGSCVVTILAIHAKKMEVPFDGVKATVEKKATPTGSISEILVEVHYPGVLSKEIKEKLENAAKHCPIHQCIDSKIKQVIVIKTTNE